MRAAGGRATFVSGGTLPLRIKALAPRSEVRGSARSRVQATPSQSAYSCRSPRRLALRCCRVTLARGLHEGSSDDMLDDDPYWRDFYGNDDDDGYDAYYRDFYGGDDADDDDEARASACRRIGYA
mmetsp:Transcript_11170/g.28290  ORF Transcript_11170/g.28290 Transcript_11170/m.28290 type:complete len:125 (+) Transcript_11170:54-428(+)